MPADNFSKYYFISQISTESC